MKGSLTLATIFAGFTAAAPALVVRQESSNELTDGACKPYIFIFARGSIEQGNMGAIIGPPTCTALKAAVGADNLACQGVGGAYTASIFDNAQPAFTSQAAINEAKGLFQQAVEKCPDAKIVFGGYSQGGAVMHGAVSTLDNSVKNHLAGGVLFGDSMNGRNSGKIPNYPADRILEICNDGDGICAAMLAGITGQHLTYGVDGSPTKAATFLAQRLNAPLDPLPESMNQPSTTASSGGGGLFGSLLSGLGGLFG